MKMVRAGIGGRSVAENLANISPRELMEWMAYDRISPFGPERQDWRTASIVHAIIRGAGGKGARSLKLKDCVLQFGSKVKAQLTWQQIKAKMSGWIGRMRKDSK